MSRKKYFYSIEELKKMESKRAIPGKIRSSLALKFIRHWSNKLDELEEVAKSEKAREAISEAVKVIDEYADDLGLTDVINQMKKMIK